MDYARDLGRVDVWEESLKRSLERRGRPRRSSVELHRLRPERDLTLGDVLQRSTSYSELRRRAAQRTAMPRPSLALGGISALALVAGSTLPSLLGSASAARKQRVAYASDAHSKAKAEAAVRGNWTSSVEPGGGSVQTAGSSAASLAHGTVSHGSGGSVSQADRHALGKPGRSRPCRRGGRAGDGRVVFGRRCGGQAGFGGGRRPPGERHHRDQPRIVARGPGT